MISAADLDQAEAFYSALGLLFQRHAHGNGPMHLAAELGDQVFEIYPLKPGEMPTIGTRVGFSVPSVDLAYSAVLAAGGSSVSAPKPSPWGRRAVVSDPDGHRIELTQPLPNS